MKELFTAMAKAFPEIEGALKDSVNPHFKSKYADLTSITMAVKPALAKYGLSYIQKSHIADGGVCVETVILHSSGDSLSCGMFYAPATKQDAQGYGSAFTYARRYSLSAAFGVCPEDDDGNAAVASTVKYNTQPISMDQLEKVQDLIAATQSDVVAICKKLKVNSLKEMTQEQYAYVTGVLEKKKG